MSVIKSPTSGPRTSAGGQSQGITGYGYTQGQQQYAPQLQDAGLQNQLDVSQNPQQYTQYPSNLMSNMPQQAPQQFSYEPIQKFQPRPSAAVEVLPNQFGVLQYYPPSAPTSVPSPITQQYASTPYQQQIAYQSPAHTGHGPQSPSTSGPVEGSPLYVNAKQFHRISKRRVARQQLEERLKCTTGIRKPYIHESRHKHAARRPRGPGGRFLTRDGMEGQGNKVQNGTPDESQTPKTRTRPNKVKREATKEHVTEVVHWQLGEADMARRAGAVPFSLTASADTKSGVAPLPSSFPLQSPGISPASHVPGTFGARPVQRTSNVRGASKPRNKNRIIAEDSFKISKAMTTSFYGADELEALHKKYSKIVQEHDHLK